uniref:Uncharacterized protein n=1 Tax=Cannabis sativa TaxID=3483 RepID=A0A803QTI3_CANSA
MAFTALILETLQYFNDDGSRLKISPTVDFFIYLKMLYYMRIVMVFMIVEDGLVSQRPMSTFFRFGNLESGFLICCKIIQYRL